MKKSKVTKVTKFDKKDDYGNTAFAIEFENGDKGFYRTKKEDQVDFVVGKESEYTIEEKVGKNDKVYFTIKLPQTSKPFGKPSIDPRIQMISFSMSYTKDLIVADKVKIEKLEECFEKIYNKMISKI